jgi:SAM-dependent methyltransferase
MGLLKNWLALPEAPATLDLDTPEGVVARARLIREKGLLRKYYEYCYEQFVVGSTGFPAGPRVEIGSGGGFLRDYVPDIIETDVMEGSRPRIVMSGAGIPFRDRCVSVYFSLNVIHHIPDPDAFFRELVRTTRPGGGIVLVEPANTPLSAFIYTNFHHEGFDTKAGWTLPPGGGPMSHSNQALPWILFFRDRAVFEKKYPELRIDYIRHHSALLYILSGGISMRQLLPTSFYGLIRLAETIMGPLQRVFGLFMTVKITRV